MSGVRYSVISENFLNILIDGSASAERDKTPKGSGSCAIDPKQLKKLRSMATLTINNDFKNETLTADSVQDWSSHKKRRLTIINRPLTQPVYSGIQAQRASVLPLDDEKTSADLDDIYKIFDYEAFYNSDEDFPSFAMKPKPPPPPRWRRFCLPKDIKRDVNSNCICDERRNEASKYVLRDLINRVRIASSGIQNAIDNLKKDREEKNELLDKLHMEERKRHMEDKKRLLLEQESKQKPIERVKLPVLKRQGTGTGITGRKQTTKKAPVRCSLDDSLLSERRDILPELETEDNWLPETKLKVVRDFLRGKKWQPSENDQMRKVNELVDHCDKLTKACELGFVTKDMIGWTDESEKLLFADLLEQIKKRKIETQFSPLKTLGTAYLRLSDESVQLLEKMCQEMGIDPGVHRHTKVLSFDDLAMVWSNDSRNDSSIFGGEGLNTPRTKRHASLRPREDSLFSRKSSRNNSRIGLSLSRNNSRVGSLGILSNVSRRSSRIMGSLMGSTGGSTVGSMMDTRVSSKKSLHR